MKKRLVVISLLITAVFLFITATACGSGTSTVSFDSDGGTAVESVVVIKGEKAIEPVPPKKDGYTFGGWLYDGEIFDFHETPVEKDMTLKAKWTRKEYKVTFIDHDGTILKIQQVFRGESATAPSDPQKEGYTFVGWDKDFSAIKSELTVVAKYQAIEPEYDLKINGYNTQSATGGFKANEGLFLYKYGQEVGSSVYWHKIAFAKIGGKYSVTAVVATGGYLPQTYEYVLLSYQNDGSGTYGKLLNLGIVVGDELEFSEDVEALTAGVVSVGVKVNKIDPSAYDFSKLLDRVSDRVTSNTIDSLPSTVAGVELTWSSENPDLYTVHQGRGYTNRIHQTHKKQSVKVSLLVGGQTYAKTITIDPVLFKEPINPKTAYFSVSTMENYKANSERYISSGQIFSDKVKNGIDMIYYAFAVPQDATGNITLDTKYLSQVMELHSYGVRVLLVIDGANTAPLKAMTVACNGDMTRKNFVDNVMNLVKTYNFDGVDVDWEFPGILSTVEGYEGFTTAVDQVNYNKLLRDLREAMDSYQDADGTKFILSCAVPSAYPTSRFTFTGDDNLGGMNDYVDYVNMMSYDLNNTLYTSHVSACYTSTQPNDHHFGCVMGVDMFVNKGLDKNKIIIGCAGYGKAYKITGEATATGLNSPAQLTKFDGIAGSYASGTIFYIGIKQCIDSGKFTKHTEYDANGNFVGSYLYNPTDKTFITYDSAEAIKAKCEFAKANGVGIMLWSYGEDATDTIVNAMIDNIR